MHQRMAFGPSMDQNNDLPRVQLEMDISPICSIPILHKYKPYAPPASQQNVTKGSDLRSPPSTVLPITNIQSSKVGQIGPPHSRPIHSKHSHQRYDIQNDQSHRPTEDPPHPFMYGEIRYKRCVPLCPYQKISPSVSSLHDRPETILLSGPPIRIISSPLGLHKNYKLPPYYHSGKADKHNGLYGRLNPLVPLQGNLRSQHHDNHKFTRRVRFSPKPKEIANLANPEYSS